MAHLNQNTRLVTIGVGGNDAGFKPILCACIKQNILTIYATPCLNNQGAYVASQLASLDHGDTATPELFTGISGSKALSHASLSSYPSTF
jgi:hypothetical protein